MSENLQESVSEELARIADLELTQQPEAYEKLRDLLETELDTQSNAG